MINSIVNFFYNMRCTDNEIIAREIIEDMVRSAIYFRHGARVAGGKHPHVNNLHAMIRVLASALDQITKSNINRFDEATREKVVIEMGKALLDAAEEYQTQETHTDAYNEIVDKQVKGVSISTIAEGRWSEEGAYTQITLVRFPDELFLNKNLLAISLMKMMDKTQLVTVSDNARCVI